MDGSVHGFQSEVTNSAKLHDDSPEIIRSASDVAKYAGGRGMAILSRPDFPVSAADQIDVIRLFVDITHWREMADSRTSNDPSSPFTKPPDRIPEFGAEWGPPETDC